MILSDVFREFKKEETEQTVSSRFEQQVDKYRDRVAVRSGGKDMSYGELSATANAIAHAIVAQHDASNKPVILLLDHEAKGIGAILGTLKAGKICVPLQADCNQERAAGILAETQAQLVITDEKNFPRALGLVDSPHVILNVDEIDAAGRTESFQAQISPDAFAYILYTSGSTGHPKGVVQSHRNLLHDLRGYTNCFQISPGDRITLFAACSGAQGMKTALSALVNGAALCLWDIKQQGLATLGDWLIAENITLYISTPMIFRNFVNTFSGTKTFPQIRLIKLGSEPLLKEDVHLFRKHFSPQCVLVNWYSSTETGNISYNLIDKKTEILGDTATLGMPHADKQILLLNDLGCSVGVEEIGEIAVKSCYLPIGYWRRPDLTNAKFLPAPKGGAERICLTGDLGVMHEDGCLEYLGRKDSRVKIRGFTVDLKEIESALRHHPGVADAVVEATGDSAEKRLIAYIVCADRRSPTMGDLRRSVRRALPDYMVPAKFVFLESLPLTANGKVDRRALPEPRDERPDIESRFEAPQDRLQHELAKIWETVLGVKPIGVRDSFFDLGGHSLLAVRLIAEIEKAFTKRLAPAVLFQAPNIEQLAEIIRHGPESLSNLVPIQLGGRGMPFFWIHGDSSNAFLPRYLGTDQPLYGLEHQSQDGKPARYTSVESIAAHYLREIGSVQAQGPYYLGGYSFGSIVALEIAQQLKYQAQEVALLALLDPPRPFKISDNLSTRLSHGPTSIDRLHSRLHRHYTNINSLGYKRGIAYLSERSAGKITGVRSSVSTKISNELKKALIKICLARGRDLPSSVRSRYILDVYSRALKKYEMRPYSGLAVLFKSETRSDDYVKNWERYLVGEKKLYEVPGDHLDLRQEPYIRNWAEKLSACMAVAQATNAARSKLTNSLSYSLDHKEVLMINSALNKTIVDRDK